jgi:hypothetical protein
MPPHPLMIRFIDVMDAVAARPAPVILIVEDDPLLRMLAVEFVNEAGFDRKHALVSRAAPRCRHDAGWEKPGNEPFCSHLSQI